MGDIEVSAGRSQVCLPLMHLACSSHMPGPVLICGPREAGDSKPADASQGPGTLLGEPAEWCCRAPTHC